MVNPCALLRSTKFTRCIRVPQTNITLKSRKPTTKLVTSLELQTYCVAQPKSNVEMPASCLNQSLLDRALSGTSVNATLLVEVLSVLCPEPKPRLDGFANHWGTVLIAYSVGFLPWGFVVLFDFISAKWKTVRETRRAGWLHMATSAIPMTIVIAYAIIQGISQDFKEMMTAVIAVLLTVYHVARTVWGLAQLNAFRTWCAHALQCIRAFPGTKQDEVDLDNLLMVNNELVDNEFSGRDITVKIGSDFRFVLYNPYVCTTRWYSAFLMAMWDQWGVRLLENLTFNPTMLFFLLNSTLFVPGRFSMLTMFAMHQLQKNWEDRGLRSGAFNGEIRPFQSKIFTLRSPLDLWTFELENIKGSYPTQLRYNDTNTLSQENVARRVNENRRATTIDEVEIMMIAKSLDPQLVQSMIEDHERCKFHLSAQQDTALQLFCQQVAPSLDSYVSSKCLNPIWRLFLIPLWREKPNKYVLEASAHVDIYCALRKFLVDEDPQKDVVKILQPGTETTIMECYRSYAVENTWKVNHVFSGVGLDAIRTHLGEWISRRPLLDPSAFLATLKPDAFEFQASDFVCTLDVTSYYIDRQDGPRSLSNILLLCRRVVWECQQALQSSLVGVDLENDDFPACPSLIMLLLCVYPFIRVKLEAQKRIEKAVGNDNYIKKEWTGCLEIVPECAPQSIRLGITVNQDTGRVALCLKSGDNVNFRWQEWINAAMGLMKGQNELVKSKVEKKDSISPGQLEMIKPADISRPLLCIESPHVDLPEFKGELKVWTGWPIFDVRLCQFEKDQIMNAYGPIQGNELQTDDQARERAIYRKYMKRLSKAEHILRVITGWDRS